MSNYIIFTYQHTCKSSHDAFLKKNAPFKSVKIKLQNSNKFKIPFLGEGFYFWEENLSAAHKWGKKHCKNDYKILEYIDLKIDKDDILDFLNRRHISYFEDLKKEYILKRPESRKWRLASWIEFFKKINETNPGFFPFNFFRADENFPDLRENNEVKKKTFFSEFENYYTFMDPLYILCALNKSNLIFSNVNIYNKS
jgi:hypothetical protein